MSIAAATEKRHEDRQERKALPRIASMLRRRRKAESASRLRLMTLMGAQWMIAAAPSYWCATALCSQHHWEKHRVLTALCGVSMAGVSAKAWKAVRTLAPRKEMQGEERGRMLAAKLRKAFASGDGLSLAFQPIFDSEGGIAAVESLIRWNDPEEGNISPAEFIPVAEAAGSIVPLNEWVLRESCLQMRKWLDDGLQIAHIAVNVSVLQVWRTDFVSSVERILNQTGLAPYRLELEVTESALCRDFDEVKRNLQALRRIGVRISIDDFGTGYSSLGRLRELDADVLKIDRVFVSGASESTSGVTMVQSIIGMAHSLGLKVVAEGVETADQHKLLSGMKCDAFQGFHFSKPLPSETFTNMFAPGAAYGELVQGMMGALSAA